MSWRRPWHSDEVEVIGWREAADLVPEVAKQQFEHGAGLVSYPFLLLLRRNAKGEVSLQTPPPSAWVSAATEIAKMQLDHLWMLHSERTWRFATALAEHDGVTFDPQVLYVASLLHDTGIRMEERAECFAEIGAQFALSTAEQAGVDQAKAEHVAEAIRSHISVKPTNQLGRYVRAGSLMDLTGTHVWHLDRKLVLKVCSTWTRVGFPAEARYRWAQECALFPNGRAAFARRPGALVAATYIAPLPRGHGQKVTSDEG